MKWDHPAEQKKILVNSVVALRHELIEAKEDLRTIEMKLKTTIEKLRHAYGKSVLTTSASERIHTILSSLSNRISTVLHEILQIFNAGCTSQTVFLRSFIISLFLGFRSGTCDALPLDKAIRLNNSIL